MPFALASLALVLATLGLVAVERRLPAAGTSQEATNLRARLAEERRLDGAKTGFLIATGLLALGYQLHVFVNAAPLYLRFAQASDLEYLLPVFWVGFCVAMYPGAGLVERFGAVAAMATASMIGAIATVMAQLSEALPALLVAQFVAGSAWGSLLMAAFTAATRCGHRGREGLWLGMLWCSLSAAAALRLAWVALGGTSGSAVAAWTPWLPSLLWLLGGVGLLVTLRRMRPVPA